VPWAPMGTPTFAFPGHASIGLMRSTNVAYFAIPASEPVSSPVVIVFFMLFVLAAIGMSIAYFKRRK
jgi:hypothetical protein